MAQLNEPNLIGQTFTNNFDTGRFVLVGRYVDDLNGDIGVFEKLPKVGFSSPFIEKENI